MSLKLLTADVWTQIKKLAKQRGRRLVAVPFLGEGARRLLPLKQGDLLVVRCNESTVRAGATDPREVLGYLGKGVKVYNLGNLHAKVLVLGRTAIVGSTNVSKSSRDYLCEAAIRTTDPGVVDDARKYIEGLCSEAVGIQYAKKLVKMYRPPEHAAFSREQGKHLKQTTPLWAVSLKRGDWDPEDYRQEKAAKKIARARVKNKRQYGIESFKWDWDSFAERLRKGHRVLQCMDEGHEVMVTAPARVLEKRRYRGKRQDQIMVCIEVPRQQRRMEYRRFLDKLGYGAGRLGALKHAQLIRNEILAFNIGALWGQT